MLVAAVMLAACSSGHGTSTAGTSTTKPANFLEQWKDIPAGPDYKGQPTRIDATQKVLYMADCALAIEATQQGNLYGPRQEPNGDYSQGYGYICPSGVTSPSSGPTTTGSAGGTAKPSATTTTAKRATPAKAAVGPGPTTSPTSATTAAPPQTVVVYVTQPTTTTEATTTTRPPPTTTTTIHYMTTTGGL